mmetsp:Transcript_24916/g.69271  ORF Transcript_24916/g.69271 Transcript_24916/m.69271 type:complete len:216 (+) Transcript_24916:302-949(+)
MQPSRGPSYVVSVWQWLAVSCSCVDPTKSFKWRAGTRTSSTRPSKKVSSPLCSCWRASYDDVSILTILYHYEYGHSPQSSSTRREQTRMTHRDDGQPGVSPVCPHTANTQPSNGSRAHTSATAEARTWQSLRWTAVAMNASRRLHADRAKEGIQCAQQLQSHAPPRQDGILRLGCLIEYAQLICVLYARQPKGQTTCRVGKWQTNRHSQPSGSLA